MAELALAARLLLGAVFALAGVAKFADRTGAQRAMVNFGVPPALVRPAVVLLPLGELAVAAALIPVVTARVGAVGALGLLTIFSATIAANVAQGNRPHCRCFGQLHSAPIGASTLVRNGVLVTMSALVVAVRPRPIGDAVAWFGDLRGVDQAGAVIAAVLVGVVCALGVTLVNVLQQQGRLLLRLDELEALLKDRSEYPGLAPGSVAPSFSLTAARSGHVLTLEALLAAGRPVLLVFTHPGCAPCQEMMPALGRWQQEHRGAVTVAVITGGGDVALARRLAEQHRLDEVLVEQDREVADSYRTTATPSAVLIGPDQRVLGPVVAGADDIWKLLMRSPETVARAQAGNGLRLDGNIGHPDRKLDTELEAGNR